MPAATMAPTKPDGKSDTAPQLIVPFVRAAQEHREAFDDRSNLISANAVQVPPIDIPAYGFMRGVWLEVTTTGGTGAAAVYKGDGPFSALTDIQVLDVNGQPIYGPYDGYEAYIVDKWGGYRRNNPKRSKQYAAPTTGNFSFLLYIPIEVSQRDALGSLANQNSASAFKLRYTFAAKSAVFSADPTTLPTVRVRAFLDAWTQPTAADLLGRPQATEPPAHGTTSFWSKTTYNVAAGFQTFRIPRVGNYIRNLVFIYRDTTLVRNAANFPAQLDLSWDTRLLRSLVPSTWAEDMQTRNVLWNSTLDTGDGLDTGVYVEDYCHEFDGHTGAEMRDGWLPTGPNTRLDFAGTYGAAGVMTVLINDVSPNGEVFV